MDTVTQSGTPASRWPRVWCLAACLCAAWCVRIDATPLTCSEPVLSLAVAAGQSRASGYFKLVNAGKSAVAITRVAPSCTCTVATVDKQSLAPGESCRVTATFSAGNRSGIEQKTISVETGDDHGAPLVLTLRARVETYLELGPRVAIWNLGSAPVEQVFECSPGTTRPIRLTEVRSSDPRIVVEKIEEVEPGRLYRAHVLARETGSAFATQLEFHAAVDGAGDQLLTAVAIVK